MFPPSGQPSAVQPSNPGGSPLPEYMDAQNGHKSKTHRGRRSKGKGAKPLHAEAKTHIQAALKQTTPAAALPHLFKAVRSLHAAKQATEPTGPTQPSAMPSLAPANAL